MTKITVLVVDDDRVSGRLIEASLSRDDRFEFVGHAQSAADGVRMAGEASPDVVLLDLDMPDRTGLEIMPTLRSTVPAAAVIVLSAYSAEAATEKARELGAIGYVEKGSFATIGDMLAEQLGMTA
jgi:DNA-binding NarL/FixJ family response regulator